MENLFRKPAPVQHPLAVRIRLYTESPDPGPGGSEQFLAVVAEALSATHEVVIVHHKTEAAEKSWAEYAGCDLGRVSFCRVAMEPDLSACARSPWARFRLAREWRREITEACDLFVGFLHNKPPFCRARNSAMVVLFPTYQPALHLNDGREPQKSSNAKKKKKGAKKSADLDFFASSQLRQRYVRWEWRRRMASFKTKFAISDFSREWAGARWGIDCRLLHPPVEIPAHVSVAKKNEILSVGRFATSGHTKKQLELLKSFSELRRDLPGWRYFSLGGLNETPADLAYFASAAAFREENHIKVVANIPRDRLLDHFATAKIFWHAAGQGDDLSAQPEMAEHFGLSTVEAMAYGCVPVVVNLGGQREIVEHGVSGFLWDSFEEMKTYTRQLSADPTLLDKMSTAAQARARAFSREACVTKLLDLIRSNES